LPVSRGLDSPPSASPRPELPGHARMAPQRARRAWKKGAREGGGGPPGGLGRGSRRRARGTPLGRSTGRSSQHPPTLGLRGEALPDGGPLLAMPKPALTSLSSDSDSLSGSECRRPRPAPVS